MGAAKKKSPTYDPFPAGYVPKAEELVPRPYRGSAANPIFTPLEVYKLGLLKCTQAEIAAFFGVTRQAVEYRFAKSPLLRAAFERGFENGSISLRRAQMQRAMEGSDTMLIWMGKQHLGQTDVERSKVELSGPGGAAIQVASLDMTALSVAELHELRRLRAKMEQKQVEGDVVDVTAMEGESAA